MVMEVKSELLYYQHVHLAHIFRTKKSAWQQRVQYMLRHVYMGDFRFDFRCDFLLLNDAKKWISGEYLL